MKSLKPFNPRLLLQVIVVLASMLASLASPGPLFLLKKKLAKKYLNFYRRHPLYSIKKSAIFGGVAGFGLATVLLGKK